MSDESKFLQDVFLKLWEQRQSLRLDTNIRALLYTMARNRSINVVRKESRKENLDAMMEENIPNEPAPADEAIDAGKLRDHLEERVSQLPPRRAEAFMLSRFHDLRYSEVASIMGLSERTVQTHVLHALRYLRSKLATYRQET